MDRNKYDAIVVGAGFAGITAARLLADQNKKILLIEERNHIGGNSFDKVNNDGVLIHLYGPHIFHTQEKRVFDYLSRFTSFIPYEHRVKGYIDGTIVPIPFNFTSIELCFEKTKAKELENKLLAIFKGSNKVSIFDLLNCEDKDIKEFGEFVFDKVFAIYTAKQWGIDISKIDKSVINRVPVVLSYDDRYFSDEYQYMPKNGFSELFEKMLNHPNIELLLNTRAEDILTIRNNNVYLYDKKYSGSVLFTGQIDRFFNYKYGHLPYRSLRFEFETHNIDSYQTAAVVNYNTSEDYTRITEFKKLTGQIKKDKTTILKEYPSSYDASKGSIPYYSINNETNNSLYEKYLNEAKKINSFYLCGRLAEYKYYNMDKVVSRAMDVVQEILEKKQ